MKKMLLLSALLTTTNVALAAEEMHEFSIWKAVPNSQKWTEATLQYSRERRADLELASDLEKFCPGYRKASLGKQDICWLRLFGAMARFESNFKIKDSFRESSLGLPPSGQPEEMESEVVGLIAVPTNVCAFAKTREQLYDPEVNIHCAITIFADAVEEDRIIDGHEGKYKSLGARKYWSTISPRHKMGKYNLGFQEQIIQLIDFKNLK